MIRSVTYYVLLGVLLIYILRETRAVSVTIAQGKLNGITSISRNGTKFFGFLGIPYAEPPIGKLRWKSPQRPKRWYPKVLNATSLPPQCLQPNVLHRLNSLPTGSEDCLYLNVYTPKIGINARLPVMVIIPGGGFTFDNSAMYLPIYHLDYEIVMVTFNYRIGVLGLLSTLSTAAPGNFALKDQVAALKWVRKNIAAFGGDPNRVTLNGHSAGGVCTELHMYSPLSTGLFQQAIAMSGSALSYYIFETPETTIKTAFTIGKLYDCPTNSTQKMIDCLRTVPATNLILSTTKNMIRFCVVIEPKSVKNRFLTENPFQQQIKNKVPCILGISAQEGAFIAEPALSNNQMLAKMLNVLFIPLFGQFYYYGNWLSEEKRNETSIKLRQFYFGNQSIGEETATELVNINTDGIFSYGSIKGAKRYRKLERIYYYNFEHQNEYTTASLLGDYRGDLGVGHGDVLFTFFPYYFPPIKTTADLKVSRRMLDYWINFVIYGNPNGDGNENDNLWEPITSDRFEYLRIMTDEDKMDTEFYEERYQFWNNLGADPPFTSKDVNAIRMNQCRIR